MPGIDFNMLRLVMRQELRLLIADRTLWIVSALLLALIGYGLHNGLDRVALGDRQMVELLEKQREGRAPLLDQLNQIMAGTVTPAPFTNPTNPANMGGALGARYAVMPSVALAPAAFGQSDLLPSYFQVTYRSKIYFIHDTEIENPWHLLSGHFDLAFVIVYLFPLMIFVLSYNLLSVEREQGTLKMLLSQPLGLLTLVVGKVAARSAALIGIAAGVPAILLVWMRSGPTGGALEPVVWWTALVAAYGLFWFAWSVVVNALGKSSAANAMILICSWVLMALIVPVVLNLLISLASPAPSRTELAARTRLVTADVLKRYAHLLRVDYNYMNKLDAMVPKNGKFELPSRQRASYYIQKDVDEQLQPFLERFETQLAKQQTLVDRYGAFSPAIVIYEGMTGLAGTGGRRYAHFMDQVEAFHQAWKAFFIPKIDAGIAITAADFDLMPDFIWREEDPATVRAYAVKGAVQLLTASAILVGLAVWRIRRYDVV